jgi:hypothetical protein
VAAILATLDRPAERGRAAQLDRRHDLELTEAHMPSIGSAPVGSMAMKDVCDRLRCLFLERPRADFRLPPGPRTVEYALLAEELGFRAVWCPEIPAFGHDIWVTLARIAEKTKRIKFGPSVLIPSYRHPMAQASAIATLGQIAPGRLMVGFGTGFTGRAVRGWAKSP